MSDTTSTPSIDPAQQRAFEDWLDATYGSIAIFESTYRASEILQRIDPIAYDDAFIRFVDEGFTADHAASAAQARLDALKTTVRERFPFPVAHYFYCYEKGARYATQQLTFLRDTWESVIFLLHALVVGEFRAMRGSLAGTKISQRQLFSDKVNDKLMVIRKLIELGIQQNLDLACGDIIKPATIQYLEDLNRVRNEFSHNSTLSDKQVREIVNSHEATVFLLLQELVVIQDIVLLRYYGSTGEYYRIEYQPFIGHDTLKSSATIEFPSTKMPEFFPYLSNTKILAYSRSKQRLFSLAPFVHFKDDVTDKRTDMCFYKQTRPSLTERILIFQVIGEATKHEWGETVFGSEMTQLNALLATSAIAQGTSTP